ASQRKNNGRRATTCSSKERRYTFDSKRSVSPASGCAGKTRRRAGPCRQPAKKTSCRLCADATKRQVLPRASRPLQRPEKRRRREKRPRERRLQGILRKALMASRPWSSFLGELLPSQTSEILRLILAASSG